MSKPSRKRNCAPRLKEEITTDRRLRAKSGARRRSRVFLEVFYRKHGYADVNVHYTIESQNRLRLDITEGPRYTLGTIVFDGNVREPSDKLFEYAVGPTRERYSRGGEKLPFVAADMQEGANLVHRFYLAEGFLDAVVDAPRYTFHRESSQVDVVIPIHEGRQYFFGSISFQRAHDLRFRNTARADAGSPAAALHRCASRRYSAASPGVLQDTWLLRREGRRQRRAGGCSQWPSAGANHDFARDRFTTSTASR